MEIKVLQKSKSDYFIGLLGILCLSQALMGCKPEMKPGLYSGELYRDTGTKTITQKVQTELTLDRGYYGHISVKNAYHTELESADIKWNHRNANIKIKIPSLGLASELAPLHLFNSSTRMFCYRGSSDFIVNLCFGRDQFSLNVIQVTSHASILNLDGLFDSQQKELSVETPRHFTRAEAIQDAFTKSFDSQIEYQVLMESRQKSIAMDLNLFPHLSFKDIFAISSLVPKTIATFVADFVPFLLPTRWYQRREAEALYDAEKLTLDILRADQAYRVEASAFAYDRDQTSRRFYQDQSAKMLKAMAHLSTFASDDVGKLGTVLDELSLRLHLVENFSRQDQNRLETAIDLAKTSLAFQMGYHEPRVIQDMDVQESPEEIDQFKPLTQEEGDALVHMALQRSLELQQLDHLIVNSENQRNEWYFNWADPDAPASSEISISLIPNLARAEAVIGEMTHRRTRMAAQVKNNAESAVISLNRSLELYQIMKESIQKLEVREDLILGDIEKSVSSANLHTNGASAQYALNTYFQNQLRMNDAITAFRIAKAQIRRVLFEYYYSGIQPRTYGFATGVKAELKSPLSADTWYDEIKSKAATGAGVSGPSQSWTKALN